MLQGPFSEWLAERTTPVRGTSQDAVPGTVLVWHEHDELAHVDVGFEPIASTQATQTWTSWNPNDSPAPDGCFPMRSLADDLVARNQLAAEDCDQFVTTIHEAALRGQFSMTLTMFAVVAAANAPDET